MYDAIIIGAGPAGISASLYIRRANLNVLILYNGLSNLEKTDKIENYYGFEDGIDGTTLYKTGIKQAEKLGVEVLKQEVTSIEIDKEGFKVITNKSSFISKTVIISTGNKKINPNIKGIEEYTGKGISYCAICDAFFYRCKKVGIIGNGEFALSEANTLKNVTDDITIFTNGEKVLFDNKKYKIDERKILEIIGDNKVNGIVFEDKTVEDLDGVFIALGEAGGLDFAKTLGIITDGKNITVNKNMETNINGIYACGNITGGLLQVSKAVYEGTIAGLTAIKYIKGEY